MALIVMSAAGRSRWKYSKRNDGMAIAIRIRIGTTVQTTSMKVLCVVLDGFGFDLALNFAIT